MDDDITEYPTRRLRLHPCQFCGRQFNSETLNKHQAICRKVSNKKRKTFDAGKQRATGSDVPYKATRKTAQIYNGETRPQDDRSRYGSKPNWREKHQQLIRSIREARHVTRAMKQGGPLPAFRPSEVPSDYVNCPHCHRNFNQHAAQRHIPFCQSKHGQKQIQNNSRLNQQYDRGRIPPPQQSTQYRQQQSYSKNAYPGSHDIYNNGYKHSNSAPMIVRRNPSDYQQPPPQPPPRKTSGDGNGWGLKKLFGFGSKQEPIRTSNYYGQEDDDDYYEQPTRRPVQQQVLMRTGRTQENTDLNVRARQRIDEGNFYGRRISPSKSGSSTYGQQIDEGNSYGRRIPPPQSGSSSYGQQARYQYGNTQYNSMRPPAVVRGPPPTVVRCGDCGNIYNNVSTRYCPHCGSRR